MKTKILLLTMFLHMSSSLAQNTLNIHQKDGRVVSYGFAVKPVVTYTNTGIHLVTDNEEVDFPFDNLDMFTFSENESNNIGILMTEGNYEDVSIYDLRGILIKTFKSSGDSVSFSILGLSAGTYIIKNGKTIYKIIKL